jgi:hypothetical protein
MFLKLSLEAQSESTNPVGSYRPHSPPTDRKINSVCRREQDQPSIILGRIVANVHHPKEMVLCPSEPIREAGQIVQ